MRAVTANCSSSVYEIIAPRRIKRQARVKSIGINLCIGRTETPEQVKRVTWIIAGRRMDPRRRGDLLLQSCFDIHARTGLNAQIA
jgi:hypothetical protein